MTDAPGPTAVCPDGCGFEHTEREALAEWWRTFDGPAYPSGEEFAEALLASDWLAAHKAAAVEAALAPVRDALTVPLNPAEGRSPDYLAGMNAAFERVAGVLPPAPTEGLANACKCGDCYHPVIGPDTDGEPCDWCRDCGCPAADHTRMIRAVLPPAPTERSDTDA